MATVSSHQQWQTREAEHWRRVPVRSCTYACCSQRRRRKVARAQAQRHVKGAFVSLEWHEPHAVGEGGDNGEEGELGGETGAWVLIPRASCSSPPLRDRVSLPPVFYAPCVNCRVVSGHGMRRVPCGSSRSMHSGDSADSGRDGQCDDTHTHMSINGQWANHPTSSRTNISIVVHLAKSISTAPQSMHRTPEQQKNAHGRVRTGGLFR